ncbi:MAG: bifunctional adenosylcobinamide kinase/adenosylcobinamide-phosphate guanylyltransferase [Chloroflexi bacterium]|nr:bifunctional adenosylcobinamide kinase/adenosylcobinamide-phosphate guanylyltransferase [Chloroflexota bacterium]
MAELWFVTGGARSGKSSHAERLAAATGRPVTFIATMEPRDEELVRRVEAHRAARPEDWETVEAPLDPVAALAAADPAHCVLLDCLSLWVSNRMGPLGESPTLDDLERLEGELAAEVARLVETARARVGETVVVTNEVGSGLVPPYPLGRAYRDVLGRVNQQVSAAADRAWLLVSGRALELPPPNPPAA